MPSRVSQIVVKIKGGIRAAAEARAVARGLDAVADGTDDVTNSALAAALAMDVLSRATRRVARANALLAGTQVPAISGMALMALTAIPLAFVILPALAVALWQVTVAAAIWAAALLGAVAGVAIAVGLMAAGVVARFKRMKDVVGSAAYDLANEFWLLKETFLEVSSAGADRLMAGLADGVHALLPLVSSLRDEFTAIGTAIGDMLAGLGRRLAGMGPEITALLAQVPAVVDALGGFAGDALSLLVQLATVGAPVLVSALRTVAGWMRDLTDWFSPERVQEATATLRNFFDGVSSWWSDFTAPIKEVIGPAIDEARVGLQAWATPLGEFVAALIQIGRVLLPPITALMAGIASGLDGMDLSSLDIAAVGDALIAGGKAVIDWFGDLLAAMKPAKPFFENVLIPLFQGVLRAVSEIPGVIEVFATILGFLGARLGFLRPIFQAVGYVIGFVFGGAILRVLGSVARAIPLIGRLAGPVLTGLGKAWDLVGTKLWSFIKWATPGVVGFVRVVIGAFRKLYPEIQVIIGVLGGIVAWVKGMPGMIAAAASGMWDGITAGLGPIVDWIIDKLSWIIEKIEWSLGKINGPLSVVKDAGGGFFGAFGNAVKFATNPLAPRAGGGIVGFGELTLVGEQGPELARFPAGTRIHSKGETRNLLAAPRLSRGDRPQLDTAGVAALAPVIDANFTINLDGRVVDRSRQRIKANREQRS